MEYHFSSTGQYGPYAQHCGHSGVRYASRMPRDASFGFHHLPAEHSTPSLPQEFFEWDNQRRFLRSNGLGNTLYTLNNFIDDPFEVEEPEPDNLPHQATGSIDPSRSPIAIKNTQEATTPGSEKKFKCTVCGKTFARKQRLEACQNKHQGERPYICGGLCGVKPCQAAFGSRACLARHHREHEKKYKACKNCGTSILRQNMARHLKRCRA